MLGGIAILCRKGYSESIIIIDTEKLLTYDKRLNKMWKYGCTFTVDQLGFKRPHVHVSTLPCLVRQDFYLENHLHLFVFCSTFVCPTEIIAFSDRIEEFRAINTEVVGCSVDSVFTHLAW